MILGTSSSNRAEGCIAMVTRVLDEEDRKHLETLRELGLDEMAQRYEASLRGERTIEVKPDPLPAPVSGAVSVAEASERLGITCRKVRRYVELGLLDTESASEPGELLVTITSIVRWLDGQRRLAIIARQSPGDSIEGPDPNSLLGRLFAPDDDPEEENEEG
jgi:hypothetical protein